MNGPTIALFICVRRSLELRLTIKVEREMNKTITKGLLLVCMGVLGGLVQPAAADEWDQKTTFTFSGPVEIPGHVLPAGSYVFKLADSTGDRNTLQVLSQDEKHLYGTFLTNPSQRQEPADKPIITFDERTGDSTEAVKAWFYPGEDSGHEFVYQ